MKKLLLSLIFILGATNFLSAKEKILNRNDISEKYLAWQKDLNSCIPENVESYVTSVNESFFDWFRSKYSKYASAKLTVVPFGEISNVSEYENGDYRVVFYHYPMLKIIID